MQTYSIHVWPKLYLHYSCRVALQHSVLIYFRNIRNTACVAVFNQMTFSTVRTVPSTIQSQCRLETTLHHVLYCI